MSLEEAALPEASALENSINETPVDETRAIEVAETEVSEIEDSAIAASATEASPIEAPVSVIVNEEAPAIPLDPESVSVAEESLQLAPTIPEAELAPVEGSVEGRLESTVQTVQDEVYGSEITEQRQIEIARALFGSADVDTDSQEFKDVYEAVGIALSAPGPEFVLATEQDFPADSNEAATITAETPVDSEIADATSSTTVENEQLNTEVLETGIENQFESVESFIPTAYNDQSLITETTDELALSDNGISTEQDFSADSNEVAAIATETPADLEIADSAYSTTVENEQLTPEVLETEIKNQIETVESFIPTAYNNESLITETTDELALSDNGTTTEQDFPADFKRLKR